MNIIKFAKSTYTSLIFNSAYAVFNCAIGFITHSWWFISLGAYYSVLSIARFSVLKVKQKSYGDASIERFAGRVTGVLLIILSFCLIGINVLAIIEERGADFHEIFMIAMATYAFSKVTLAIIGLVKIRKSAFFVVKALRNISFADALVSIYSLQRSMLVSFPGMTTENIQLFNILTGTAVWALILLLGINLIGGRYVDMAKSKIVKANEKIAQTVVGAYKTIEKGVVDGYTKIEDKFVEAYLAKDGETVSEAKERIKNKENN